MFRKTYFGEILTNSKSDGEEITIKIWMERRIYTFEFAERIEHLDSTVDYVFFLTNECTFIFCLKDKVSNIH
jgi:hypothetical protein